MEEREKDKMTETATGYSWNLLEWQPRKDITGIVSFWGKKDPIHAEGTKCFKWDMTEHRADLDVFEQMWAADRALVEAGEKETHQYCTRCLIENPNKPTAAAKKAPVIDRITGEPAAPSVIPAPTMVVGIVEGEREDAESKEFIVKAVCPRCHVELPASGMCDEHGDPVEVAAEMEEEDKAAAAEPVPAPKTSTRRTKSQAAAAAKSDTDTTAPARAPRRRKVTPKTI